MSYWICAIHKECKLCFSSCTRLKTHQKRIHNREIYRYVHCKIDSRSEEVISVRILDGGECVAAFQLRNNQSQEEIIERVHKKSFSFKSKSSKHNDHVLKSLSQIKELINELEAVLCKCLIFL